MHKKTPQAQVSDYYEKLGSRFGYLFVMHRSQHFGYYDENHSNEDSAQEKYHEEFTRLLELEPGMKVLDAGCGQGVVAGYIAGKHDVNVTGVTITPHEVKSARKRALKNGVESRTSFLLADYATLPFADDTFDRIYTTESLSHAPDVTGVIAEFRRVLKPGGLLVCAEYVMDHAKFNDEAKRLAEMVKNYAAIHGVYQFGEGQFTQTLNDHGFKSVVEYDWTTYTKPSFDRLRKLARPFKAAVQALGLEHKFVNITAASMYSDGVENDMFRYVVYVGRA